MSGQLEIPGYTFDPIKKRYFKLTPAQIEENKRKVKADAYEAKSKRGNARRRRAQQVRETQEDRAKLERKLVRQQRGLERVLEEQRIRAPVWQRPADSRCLEGLALAKCRTGEAMLPDGLFVDENITALHADSEHIRVGGFGGNLLHCKTPQRSGLPEWHRDCVLNGPVTAISRHSNTFLASSLGPSALAVMSPTNEAASLASTLFTPPKTSIWTCLIDEAGLALGGDQSVLVSNSEDRTNIRNVQTKSAVFSLARHQGRLLAGTRSGDILSVDPRIQYRDGRFPQKYHRLGSSVLQLRPLQEWQLLVSCIDGSLATFDARAKPIPIFNLKGHVNVHSRELGLDIWQDSLLAAAGPDRRVRLWSLDTGQQVKDQTEGESLANQQFPASVEAMSFQHGAPKPILYAACGEGIFTYQVA